MRIVLHEHFSSRPRGAAPEDLRRAGRAMRDAFAADLAALPGVTVTIAGRRALTRAGLARAIARADATLVIAPESGRRLERLVAVVERGRRGLGPGPRAVRLAADKWRTFRLLRRSGIATPVTRLVPPGVAGRRGLASMVPPFVLKPRDGCGATGVVVVRRPQAIGHALRRARAAAAGGGVVAQPFVIGIPVSVTFVASARTGRRAGAAARALVLGVSRQALRGRDALHYAGGEAPLGGRAARAAERLAARALAALARSTGDLRGPVGVDLVLAPAGPVVIEINPRPTTSWIGLRRLARVNPARYLLDAALGRPLPRRATLRGACRFAAGGRVAMRPAPRSRRR